MIYFVQFWLRCWLNYRKLRFFSFCLVFSVIITGIIASDGNEMYLFFVNNRIVFCQSFASILEIHVHVCSSAPHIMKIFGILDLSNYSNMIFSGSPRISLRGKSLSTDNVVPLLHGINYWSNSRTFLYMNLNVRIKIILCPF